MIRRLVAAATALLAGCALLTDLDGFSGSPATSDAGEDVVIFGADDAAAGATDGAAPKLGTDFVAGQFLPTDLQAAPEGIYWRNAVPTTGGIFLRGHDGGAIASIGGNVDDPAGYHVGTDSYRWVTHDGHSFYRGRPDGGVIGVDTLGETVTGMIYEEGTDTLLWTDPILQRIRTCRMASCSAGTTASGQNDPRSLVYYAGKAYWLRTVGGTGSIGTVVPSNSQTLASIVDGLGAARALTTDGISIYVTSDDGVRVVKIATKEVSSLATGLAKPTAIALFGDVFVTTEADGKVWRIPKDGGTPSLVGEGLRQPASVAVDSTGVYVASSADGRIVRFDLP